MSYPWSPGEVLTAADLNAYAGLVLVKTQTITGTPSTVTVTSAFSSTFDHYRIIWDAKGSGNIAIDMKLSGATGATDYDYKAFYYFVYTAGGLNEVNGAASAGWRVGWINGANNGSGIIDVFNPAISGRTRFNASGASYVSVFSSGATVGTTVTSTGFSLVATTGNFTSGTIRVYGVNDG